VIAQWCAAVGIYGLVVVSQLSPTAKMWNNNEKEQSFQGKNDFLSSMDLSRKRREDALVCASADCNASRIEVVSEHP
jgi:hypothetical protein